MTKSAHGRKYATGHLDQDDRLVQVSKGVYASGAVLVNEFTVNYSYDSMGRMLRRDNGSEVTTFVWDGWDLLSETTDSVTTTYLVPDGLVWSFVRGEEVFQVHTDALGSVRVVTDSEGEVVARFEYGAWGELLSGSFDSVGLALRFVGGHGVRTDLETGLYSMRHRWYDAELQRFVSRDPRLQKFMRNQAYERQNPVGSVIGEATRTFDGRGFDLVRNSVLGLPNYLIEATDEPNLYAYVRSNPVCFFDPTGEDIKPWDPGPSQIGPAQKFCPFLRGPVCFTLWEACGVWCGDLIASFRSVSFDDAQRCYNWCSRIREKCEKHGYWPPKSKPSGEFKITTLPGKN